MGIQHLLWRRARAEDLSAYLDGVLSGAERERLEARLASDRGLRGELEGLRLVQRLVGSVESEPPPRRFVLEPGQVRVAQRSPLRPPPVSRYAFAAATVAAVMFLAVTVVAPGRSDGSQQASLEAGGEFAEAAKSSAPIAQGAAPAVGGDDSARQLDPDSLAADAATAPGEPAPTESANGGHRDDAWRIVQAGAAISALAAGAFGALAWKRRR